MGISFLKSRQLSVCYLCSFNAHYSHEHAGETLTFTLLILLHQKFLQFDWLRAVVFQLNLKYLHVKITNLLWVVV